MLILNDLRHVVSKLLAKQELTCTHFKPLIVGFRGRGAAHAEVTGLLSWRYLVFDSALERLLPGLGGLWVVPAGFFVGHQKEHIKI